MGTVFTVVVLSGCLGGLFNFVSSTEKLLNPFSEPLFYQSLIHGVTGALLIPIFLSIGESSLLEKILEEPCRNPAQRSQAILVLMGFALVASISSKSFIESITKKVLNEVAETKKELQTTREEVKTTQEQVTAASTSLQKAAEDVEKIKSVYETEVADAPDKARLATITASFDQRKILGNLEKMYTKFRSSEAIAGDISKGVDDTMAVLDDLKSKGLVDMMDFNNKKGWFLTAEGRQFAQSL